jgi:starch phosphorylase
MVREYVTRLYLPAARSSAAIARDDYAPASRLAEWKSRISSVWPEVRVDHVESEGVADVVTAGSIVEVRAFISLGSLSPDDVQVQVLAGTVDSDDRIESPVPHRMEPAEQFDQNRWKFHAQVPLDRNGPFGYTVRILPEHENLITPAEMGLQAVPSPLPGMTDGSLR